MAESTLCKAYLEEHRVPVFERPDGNSVVSADSVYALPPFSYQLFVRPQDTVYARALVGQFEKEAAGHPATDEDAIDGETSSEPVRSTGSGWDVKIGKFFIYVTLAIFFAGILWAITAYILFALRFMK